MTRRPPGDDPARHQGLQPEEKASLLCIARYALEQELDRGEILDRFLEGYQVPPRLEQVQGVFVSLHRRDPASPRQHGALRGCIGHVEGRMALYRGVIENAIHAARHDPRFDPVTAEELDRLVIEVSVLSPLQPIPGPEHFRPGPDGVEIEMEGQRAIFLPQVAPEQGWDRDQTLDHLCRKAGLPADSWRRPEARLFTFQAEVFAEGDEGIPPGETHV
jgi:AmmeMemoRadiSam system protein A